MPSSERRTRNVSLFDVVPWTVGFAHSWALRWFFEQVDLAPLVLEAVPGLPGRGPWTVAGAVRLEERLKARRTDLGLTVTSADGEVHQLAFETKVNDPFYPDQVTAYLKEKDHVVLYMPGVTGLLVAPVGRRARESIFLGEHFVAAIGDEMADEPLIAGYVHGVRHHVDLINDAREAAMMGNGWSPPNALSAAAAYRDASWLSGICRAIRSSGSPDITYRSTAYDVGYFWDSSRTRVGGRDAYVELTVDHWPQAHVWVKVGGADGDLRTTFDRLRNLDPPEGDGWTRCRWGRGGTRSVWKVSAERKSVAEGYELACAAFDYLRRHKD